MKKEDIIQIHTLLVQLRHRDEELGLTDASAFEEYDALHITPVHIHRVKRDHARAVFALAVALHKGTGSKGKVHDPFAQRPKERL